MYLAFLESNPRSSQRHEIMQDKIKFTHTQVKLTTHVVKNISLPVLIIFKFILCTHIRMHACMHMRDLP